MEDEDTEMTERTEEYTSPTINTAAPAPGTSREINMELATNPQRLIDEQYTLWLRYAPQMYDFCTTHVLEWPASAVAWLADSRREIPGRDYAIHQLAVGSTSLSVNYVTVYHAFVPCEVDDLDDLDDEDIKAFYGYSGRFSDVAPILQRYLRVVHDGPCTNIVPMPQKPQLIATRGSKPFIYLYDIGRRRAEPETNDVRADMRLKGHGDEGRGLAWNPNTAGMIASGSTDGSIQIHDVSASVDLMGTRDCVDLSSCLSMKAHVGEVSAVSWHNSHHSILASVGSDKGLHIWDIRSSDPQETNYIHRGAINDVAFHPTASFLLGTASDDKSSRVWDIRKLHKPITEFVGHTDSVLGFQWAPFNDTVALTYSSDRTICCWDMAKIHAERIPGDDDLMKPELVFQHFGHTNHIRHASWCPAQDDEWTVASIDDNNMMQLWAPHGRIVNDEVDQDVYNTEVV